MHKITNLHSLCSVSDRFQRVSFRLVCEYGGNTSSTGSRIPTRIPTRIRTRRPGPSHMSSAGLGCLKEDVPSLLCAMEDVSLIESFSPFASA